jgi:hypothetical protein
MGLTLKQSKLDFLRLANPALQGVFAQGLAMFQIADLPAGAVSILAAKAGNSSTSSWTSGITSPTFPRSVQVAFGDGWDGGDITLTGLDQFGRAQTEVIADVNATTVEGVKVWKTISRVQKEAVGSAAATFTLNTGATATGLIGLPVPLLWAGGMLLADGVAEAADAWSASTHSFVPHTDPDGAVDFTVLVPVDWKTYQKMVVSEMANI